MSSGVRFGTRRSISSTDEELLNADMGRLLLEAAFLNCPKRNATGGPAPKLVGGADELAARLRQARQPDGQALFFITEEEVDRQRRDGPAPGDRRGGSGEYVVCLRPTFDGGRVLPSATIEVWTRQPGPRWQLVRTLAVDYADAPQTGGGRADY
jgi:hypothetical protein